MPNKKAHCKSSLKRTGEDFKELHEWMDGPREELGINHRTERHDTSYIEEVKEKWGVKGVREFLRHISEDYEHTAKKWGKDCEICGKPTYKNYPKCYKCYKISLVLKEKEKN